MINRCITRFESENFYQERISVRKFFENCAKIGVSVQLGLLCTDASISSFAIFPTAYISSITQSRVVTPKSAVKPCRQTYFLICTTKRPTLIFHSILIRLSHLSSIVCKVWNISPFYATRALIGGIDVRLPFQVIMTDRPTYESSSSSCTSNNV